ncbi:MAG: LacI family DNA-binding transcriptional regulator [Tetrasphaera sp.]|nr:LacI family DNA-binding transcriptional regulator [Tetrasphaera sp.]
MTRSPLARPRVTITDVARAAAVSRQTVSNAVNNPHRLSPETLERVLATIGDLGYRPQAAAQSLRHQRTGAIGVELGTLGPRRLNETTAPLLAALGVVGAPHDFHVVPFGSSSDEPMIDGYENMWRTRLVDSFIIMDTHHGDPRPQWLEAHGIPFVSFGRVWDDPGFTRWVDVDGAAGTQAATEHLLAGGYRRVGFLGWPEGSLVGDDRWLGWERTVPESHRGPSARVSQNLRAAWTAATELIGRLEPGDALVCASDILALGVHHALLAAGRQVGAEIGLIGFDGSPIAEIHDLSTIAHPIHQAAEALLTLLRGELDAAPPPAQGRLLAPHLVARASTSGPGNTHR